MKVKLIQTKLNRFTIFLIKEDNFGSTTNFLVRNLTWSDTYLHKFTTNIRKLHNL